MTALPNCQRSSSRPSRAPTVASILIKVDLPAPSGPSRPKIIPVGMVRSTPSTARFVPNERLSPRAWTARALSAFVHWSAHWKVTSTGMPALRAREVSLIRTRTSNTSLVRWSLVSTLLGVNSASEATKLTVPV